MRRILFKRLLIGILCFAAAYTLMTHTWSATIAGWIISWGKAAGCPVTQSGVVAWGPSGPFLGEDLKVRAFNFLARNGVWLVGAIVGFVAALGAYSTCRGLERWWPLGYRGPTRCGGCGYVLHGLREPRCPECGLVI